jgi:iron-sulfur cluster repair protein YtfE (RIC family)
MEHPLITNIDHLTVDELQNRVSDLSRKLAFARRSGNADLSNQISMALEAFQNKLREKQQSLWDQQNRKGGDYSDRIDIS